MTGIHLTGREDSPQRARLSFSGPNQENEREAYTGLDEPGRETSIVRMIFLEESVACIR